MNPGKVTVEAVRVNRDPRGWVAEPVGESQLQGIRNVHVVWTLPGEVRGNHFHRETTEILMVVGPARVRWLEQGTSREEQVPQGAAWRFVFPPGVAHAIQNTGTEPGVMVALTDRPHDPAKPDTVGCVLLEKGEGHAPPRSAD